MTDKGAYRRPSERPPGGRPLLWKLGADWGPVDGPRLLDRLPRVSAFGHDSPCLYYRATIPFRGLSGCGLAVAPPPVAGGDEGLEDPGDILLLHRCESQRALDRVRDLRRGTLVVVDDDDDLLSVRVEEWTSGIAYPLPPELPPEPGEEAADYLLRTYAWFLGQAWPLRDRVPYKTVVDALRAASDQRQAEAARLGLLSMYSADALNRSIGLVSLVYRSATLDDAIAASRAISPFTVYANLLRDADLVTVSTEPLAERYRSFNERLCILPNAIDLLQPCYQPKQRALPHAGVIIGHAGSRTHQRDLSVVAPALATIMRQCDGRDGQPLVRLMIGGDARAFRGPLAELPGASEFAAEIEARWPTADGIEGGLTRRGIETLESECGRYLYRPFTLDVDAVPLMFADVDIGIVPLVLGTPINRCKSDIKGLEMAGMGVPCIASPIDAYRRHRPEGTGCLVLTENTPGEWLRELLSLIGDTEVRRRTAQAALAFAQTRSIDRWAPKWMEAYQEAGRRKGLAWAL